MDEALDTAPAPERTDDTGELAADDVRKRTRPPMSQDPMFWCGVAAFIAGVVLLSSLRGRSRPCPGCAEKLAREADQLKAELGHGPVVGPGERWPRPSHAPDAPVMTGPGVPAPTVEFTGWDPASFAVDDHPIVGAAVDPDEFMEAEHAAGGQELLRVDGAGNLS